VGCVRPGSHNHHEPHRREREVLPSTTTSGTIRRQIEVDENEFKGFRFVARRTLTLTALAPITNCDDGTARADPLLEGITKETH
jgi:hypothetical protein